MGLIVSTIRLIQLNSMRLDLEYKLMLINSSRLQLTASTGDLETLGTDLDPDSAEAKALQKRQERLKVVEQRLEEQAQRYQVQLKMIESEIQSVNSSIDSNIQMSYGGR
ncbi:TPA: hypothetical protein IAA68_03400 [Candidatus Galligastranaerophilus faecipullorum]|nr:hypothetical protein [Candidatus Galligastranaerophilus faecipullorum]